MEKSLRSRGWRYRLIGVSNSPDDDTLYALVFDSESSFADFGSIWLDNIDLAENLFYDQGHRPGSSPEIIQNQLVKILENNNIALTLYEGNVNDLSDWTRQTVKNNGEFVEKNCN